MMSNEVSDLSIDLFDTVEQSITTLSKLIGVDWIVVPRTNHRVLLAAQVEHYEHIRFQAHLHIKHYVKIKREFTIPYSKLDIEMMKVIGSATNLAELPDEFYTLIQNNIPAEIEENDNEEKPVIAEEESVKSNIHFVHPINNQTVSSLDRISKSMHVVELPPEPKVKPTKDNQIITHDSIAYISQSTDPVDNYKTLHSSILALQDYLRINMKDIYEFHSPDSDVAFRGLWHDDTPVEIMAYSLNDSRGHAAWYIKVN